MSGFEPSKYDRFHPPPKKPSVAPQDEVVFDEARERVDNPYQAPQTALRRASGDDDEVPYWVRRALLPFRRWALGLGIAWIVVATLGVFGLFVLLSALQEFQPEARMDPAVLALAIVVIALWYLSGLFACMKHLWAIRLGLTLSYVTLVGNLLRMNLFAAIVIGLFIVAAHRTLGLAKDVLGMGIPLNTRP